MTADYTFKEACQCGNKPVLKVVGMCSVCTYGEAGSMWEWLQDFVVQKERKKAQDYVMETIVDVELITEEGEIDPLKAMLLHIDQQVLDEMEELFA